MSDILGTTKECPAKANPVERLLQEEKFWLWTHLHLLSWWWRWSASEILRFWLEKASRAKLHSHKTVPPVWNIHLHWQTSERKPLAHIQFVAKTDGKAKEGMADTITRTG